MNEVIVKTTASIKEITTILSSTVQTNKKENIPIEAEHTKTIIKETNSNTNSAVENTDSNNNTLIAEEQSIYSSSPQNKPDSIYNNDSKNVQKVTENKISEITTASSQNTATASTHTSITEKRYEALLKQNPLLEELKRKLNLEFK